MNIALDFCCIGAVHGGPDRCTCWVCAGWVAMRACVLRGEVAE